ncbi:MAG: hypothetical protein JWP04_4195 [Belnapia sp.]|nr:hypothetical protein [Belnapia sp.]
MPVENDPTAKVITDRLPLVVETAQLHKSAVESGRVRVSIRTETDQRTIGSELRSEAVTVERVAIGRELAPGEALPVPREERDGALFIVPVIEEVLVVEKRLVLREELHLHRTASLERVEHPVTLRRQEASVERLPARLDGDIAQDSKPSTQEVTP